MSDDPILQRFMHPQVDNPEDFEPEDVEEAAEEDEPEWAQYGKLYRIGGQEIELFPIGALAQALGRKSVTIRSWETKEWFPRTFISGPPQVRGRRRLYTREMIEGTQRIAAEEGLMVESQKAPPMERTNFPERTFVLFEEIRKLYGWTRS